MTETVIAATLLQLATSRDVTETYLFRLDVAPLFFPQLHVFTCPRLVLSCLTAATQLFHCFTHCVIYT